MPAIDNDWIPASAGMTALPPVEAVGPAAKGFEESPSSSPFLATPAKGRAIHRHTLPLAA